MTRDSDRSPQGRDLGSACEGAAIAQKEPIMTDNTTQTRPSQSGVTQADRLAAATVLDRNGRRDDASDMRRGMLDHFELVQAFARHRQPLLEAVKEALTPSCETKAAYWGEFHFHETEWDEDGEEVTIKRTVPWTTVKEIMDAIRKRAAIDTIIEGK